MIELKNATGLPAIAFDSELLPVSMSPETARTKRKEGRTEERKEGMMGENNMNDVRFERCEKRKKEREEGGKEGPKKDGGRRKGVKGRTEARAERV